MKKIVLTAVLYSKKNYDLSYKLHSLCKRYGINMLNVLDFVELTIKCVELKPQIVFCDCDTVEFSSANLNSFLEKNEFKDVKFVFVGEENNISCLRNIVCKNLMISTHQELSKVIDDLQNNFNYAKMLESQFDCSGQMELEICKLLSQIGLSPKHTGYAYLRYGIKNIVLQNGVLNSLNSEQYPIIASKFKTSAVNVERNIRNAINQAWVNSGKNGWNQFFFSKSVMEGKKPTNREFLSMCSEIILYNHQDKLKENASICS